MIFSNVNINNLGQMPKYSWWIFVTGLGLFFAIIPYFIELFVILEMSRFFGMALLALSMGFLWGYGGMLSFGQTAFFGVGGYSYSVLALNTGETTGALFFAVTAGMFIAAALGYFMIYGRISNIYFSVITLVFTLILEKGIRSTSGDQYVIGKVRLKGQNGIPNVPQLEVPWKAGIQLDINWFFYTGAISVLCVYVGLRLLLASPFGRVLVGIRENENRAELLGYDVRKYKFLAFTICGGIAGLGGALYAISIPLAHPEMFSLGRAADVVMWVLIGGKTSLIGPVSGVFAIEYFKGWLGTQGVGQVTLVLGAVLIIFVLVFQAGLIPTITCLPGVWRERALIIKNIKKYLFFIKTAMIQINKIDKFVTFFIKNK
ncbi:MAG: branched-chain amino acid ABC transporter permease [Rhodospirillaceae bacterium]|nr:branched-chain amino acid ABC transporter permease [Rhodospirillaceae bacterium]|tara:strand:- start:167 stop:1288 length:1122 start_codon:yes stop_codon:yes gene_type:complete